MGTPGCRDRHMALSSPHTRQRDAAKHAEHAQKGLLGPEDDLVVDKPLPTLEWASGDTETRDDISVSAASAFLDQWCSPDEIIHAWAYRIKIINRRDYPIQITRRTWEIRGTQDVHNVVAEGILGSLRTVLPGEAYEYTTAVPFSDKQAVMTGVYDATYGVGDNKKEAKIPTPEIWLREPRLNSARLAQRLEGMGNISPHDKDVLTEAVLRYRRNVEKAGAVFDTAALHISPEIGISARSRWEIERSILRATKTFNEAKKAGSKPILLDLSDASRSIMGSVTHDTINIPCDDYFIRGTSQGFIFQARRIVENVQDTRLKFEGLLRSIGIDQRHPEFSNLMILCFPLIAEARSRIRDPHGSRDDWEWPNKTYAEVHRETGENIVCYLERYLGNQILAGVASRKKIREMDPSAEVAIVNYIRRRGSLPSYITPKTKKNLVDKELTAQMQAPKDKARLRQARYRRQKKLGIPQLA